MYLIVFYLALYGRRLERAARIRGSRGGDGRCEIAASLATHVNVPSTCMEAFGYYEC